VRSFTRFIGFALLPLVLGALACEEDGSVLPPPPAPQINVVIRYAFNPDPTDTVRGLQNNDTYDIIVDSSERTWVTTNSGVSRFIRSTGDGVFNEINALPNSKCRSVVEHNGRIWIGTWGGGVGIYDLTENAWSKLNVDSGLVNNQVADIYPDGDSVYFATNAGVSIYNDDDQLPLEDRWSTQSGLKTALVSVIEMADTPSRGREIWYGPRMEEVVPPGREDRYGITVVRRDLSQTIYYTMVNSALAEPNVNDIMYDEDADLFWVAFATAGLATVDVDAKVWTYYTDADGLPSTTVFSITKIDGTIWVGTQRGMARQKPDGRFQGYDRSGGLPGDRVRKVYSDKPSQLWACFIDSGAALLDPDSAQ
jgi:ligand-binding sensor domain-containing protein